MFDFRLGRTLQAGGYSKLYNPSINYSWDSLPPSNDYVTDGVNKVNGIYSFGSSIITDNGDSFTVTNSIDIFASCSLRKDDLTVAIVNGETLRYKIRVKTDTDSTIKVYNGSAYVSIGNTTANVDLDLDVSVENTDDYVSLVLQATTATTMTVYSGFSVERVIQKPNIRTLNDSGSTPKYHAESYFGRGVSFNGVDQGITTGSLRTIINSSSMSVMLTYTHGSSDSSRYLIYISDGGSARMYVSLDSLFIGVGTIATKSVDSGIDFISGDTYHIAYVVSGTTCSIYIDGVLRFSTEFVADVDRAYNFQIGVNGGLYYNDCTINNIVATNQSLTPQQIKYQYDNPERFLYREDNILKSQILNQSEIDNVVAYLPVCENDGYVRDLVRYSEGVSCVDSGVDYINWDNLSDAGVTTTASGITFTADGTYLDAKLATTFEADSYYLIEYEVTENTINAGNFTPLRSNGLLTAPVTVDNGTLGKKSLVVKTLATITEQTYWCYISNVATTGVVTIKNISARKITSTYPIQNYTTSCNAKNLQSGLQTCFWKRDLLGVPYASSFNALECDGVGYVDTGWIPQLGATYQIEAVFYSDEAGVNRDFGSDKDYFRLFSDNTLYYYFNGAFSLNTIVPFNEYIHVVLTAVGSNATMIVNGTIEDLTGLSGGVQSTTSFALGGDRGTEIFNTPLKLFKVHTTPQDPLELYNKWTGA